MLRDLFKRSSIYFGTLTIVKLVSVAAFVLFARVLKPEQFGALLLYATLGQIITFLGDFGLVQWYQKKVHSNDPKSLFSQLISARLFTLLVTLVAAFVFFRIFPTFSSNIVTLFLITMVPDAILSALDGYYFYKKQSYVVSLKLMIRMSFLLGGYFFYGERLTFEIIAFLYLLIAIINLLWYFPWRLAKFLKFESFSKIIDVLKSSFSYAFLVLTSFAYARGDSVVIGYSLGNTFLGLYGAAYRFLEAASLLPTALAHNLFPESAKEGNLNLKQLKKITLTMFVLGVISSLILYTNSELLIRIVLGSAYVSAVPLLKIFSVVTLLFFVSSPLNTVVLSSRLVSKFLPYGAVNTLLNIALNIMFVPVFGILAAAWVMLTTEVIGLLINLYFVKKVYS